MVVKLVKAGLPAATVCIYIYCIALRALLLLLSLPLLLMTVQIHHVDTEKISMLLSTYSCVDYIVYFI